MTEVLAGLLVLSGGAFALVAGLGLLRLPDVLMRMHAATKVGTLGAGLILAAAALRFGEGPVTVRVLLIVLFLFLTAPIAGHLIGRAALRPGVQVLHRDGRKPP